MEAKNSTTSLRSVFNDTTRGEQSAEDISLKVVNRLCIVHVVKLRLVIFYSEQIYECLSNATNVYFDGTLKSILDNFFSSGYYLFNLEDMCYQQFTAR